MKTKTTLLIILTVSWMLCASVFAETNMKSITDHPNYSNLKTALENFVKKRSLGERTTLVIPKYLEEGGTIVIYWVEESALFDFTLDFNADAVKHAVLLNRRFYRLTDEFFYSANPNNSAHHSSTFMNTWEWAKEKIFVAVKDGYILTIEINDKSEQ